MNEKFPQIADQIRNYLIQEFLPGESPDNLTDDTALLDSGILDSMSTLKLVSHVEETYGVTVDAHDAATEFNTIREIAQLVERKS